MSKPVHILVDTGNLSYREIAIGKSGETEQEIVSMTMAGACSFISNAYEMFGASHTMLAFESYSWRRKVFPEYKSARRAIQPTKKEAEVQRLLYEAIDKFRTFVENETNATPIRAELAEGDDIIARWIELHPDAEHVIISTDGDMHQLVRPGVSAFSGQQDKCWTAGGVLASEQKLLRKTPVSFQKWNSTWRLLDQDFDPSWSLFKKIMRGDAGDSVPTAVKPRTRTKLIEAAFQNPDGPEFAALMQTVREDLPGRPLVSDLVKRNAELVDLTYRPSEVNQSIDAVVKSLKERERRPRVGIKFQMFCRDNGMGRAGELAQKFVRPYSLPVNHEAIKQPSAVQTSIFD